MTEIGNHLQLAIMVMKHLFIGLRVEHGNAVLIKIRKGEPLLGTQLDPAKFLVAKIVDTNNEPCLFFIK